MKYIAFTIATSLPMQALRLSQMIMFFIPLNYFHDVLCYGFTWSFDGQEIIYATDTSSMENAPKKEI